MLHSRKTRPVGLEFSRSSGSIKLCKFTISAPPRRGNKSAQGTALRAEGTDLVGLQGTAPGVQGVGLFPYIYMRRFLFFAQKATNFGSNTKSKPSCPKKIRHQAIFLPIMNTTLDRP